MDGSESGSERFGRFRVPGSGFRFGPVPGSFGFRVAVLAWFCAYARCRCESRLVAGCAASAGLPQRRASHDCQTVTVKDKDGRAGRGLDREGLHRHRGRRAADDQLRRVPAAWTTSTDPAPPLAPAAGPRRPRRCRRPTPDRSASPSRPATSATATGGCWCCTST